MLAESPRFLHRFAVRPNAEPKRKTFRVIFLPDVRKINVADLVFIVKSYQQRAVANRNITHNLNYSTRVLQGLSFEIGNLSVVRRFGVLKLVKFRK